LENRESSPIASMTTQTAFASQIPFEKSGNAYQSGFETPKNTSVPKGAAFLSLLNVQKGKAVVADFQVEARSINTATRSAVNPQTKSVLRPVSETRITEIASKLDSKANSQSSVPSSGSKEYLIPPQGSIASLSSNSILDDDSEKENSQESSKDKISRTVPNDIGLEFNGETGHRDVSDVLIAQILEGNPFEGMKRVPRSYVQVPKNQQALLASENSWRQPESSSRPSYANLPPEVAHNINFFIDRKQHGQKTQPTSRKCVVAARSSHKAPEESEESESDEGDQEDGEDDTGEKEDAEHILAHTKESKETIHDDPVNDDESVISWPETQYSCSSPKRDDFQGAPGPSSEDDTNGFVEKDDVDEKSTTPHFPSARRSSPPSPLLSNIPVAPNMKPKIDYNFPPSSPGDEEELEIAVPYAIDDQVDENAAEFTEEQQTSQELPSTAVCNQPVLIQVEQTPDHHVSREPRQSGNGKQLDPKRHRRIFIDAESIDGHVSSDHVVPASFHDSSQERLTSPKSGHYETSDKRSRLLASSAEEHHFTLQADDRVDGLIDEDEMAQEQLFTELISSQRRKVEAMDSLPPTTSGRRNSQTPIQNTPTNNTMPQIVSPLLHSPQQPKSSSFHTAVPEVRSEIERASSSPVKTDSPQRSNRVELEVSKFKGPRNAKSLITKASQTGSCFIDTEDLTRAARHSFHENHPEPPNSPSYFRDTNHWTRTARNSFYERNSSPVEEVPVIQIPQSQPNPPITKERSPVQPSASAILPYSSNDFVCSSIPESREEVSVVDHTSKNQPTTVSKELSTPAILDQAQCSPHKTVISSVVSPRTSRRTSRQPGASETAVLAQSTQNSRQNGGEPEEKKMDVVSLSSESDEENLSHEEGEDVTNDKVLTEEEETAEEEMIDEGGMSQSIETQHLRSQSPQPTAFDKFKSIYPSYGGKEKTFVWALVYIEWLVESKGEHFLRASLWDDLIRSLAAEYMEYMREARWGDSIKTGFEYFNKLDQEPIFQQRMMTPDNLQESLLTLDPAQVEKARLLFSKSAAPPTEHSESAHGLPSVTSNNSQNNQTQEKSVPRMLVDNSGPSRTSSIAESRSLQGPKRTSTKRPFFETPSQLDVAKIPRFSNTPRDREGDVEVPQTSKSRRSLPWNQSYSSQSTPNPMSRDEPIISTPASSARLSTTSAIPKSKQIFPASASYNCGSPASPILGDPAPKSRSFDVSDIRAGSTSSSLLFKKPSAPVSQAALMQHSGLVRSRAGRVEGWLDDTEPDNSHETVPTAAPKLLPRKESIKRKRESGLELLDMQTSASEAKSRRMSPPVNRAVASSSGSHASNAATGAAKVRKVSSFRDFLQKRRESGELSRLSRPSSKVSNASGKRVEQTPVKHAEPETQAWVV
jgi:hypothetical protein